MMFAYLLTLILTAALTAVILRFLIPYLKSRKLGQKILDIGPRWHKSKEGTPTMGGLSFLIAFAVIVTAVLAGLRVSGWEGPWLPALFTGLYALMNGGIGILDDRTKFSKGKNEGLLSWQKYLLQLFAALLYLGAMGLFGGLSTDLYLPFLKITLPLGWLFYPFAVILLTGVVNSVEPIKLGKSYVYVAGVDDYAKGYPKMDKVASQVREEDFVIFAGHSPNLLPAVHDARDQDGNSHWYDLALFGHTHGGQINLFGYTPLRKLRTEMGRHYQSGLLAENRAYILVSNGVGTEYVPLRLFAAPQVHLIVLKKGS